MTRLPSIIQRIVAPKPRPADPLRYDPTRPTSGPEDQMLQDMLRRLEGNTETTP